MELREIIEIARFLNDNELKGEQRAEFLKNNYGISDRTWQKKIKNTSIKYNNKTKKYDIPNVEQLESNTIDTTSSYGSNPKKTTEKHQSGTKATMNSCESNTKETTPVITEIIEVVDYEAITPKEEFNGMKNDIEYIKEQLNILFKKIEDKEEREKNIIHMPKIDLEQYELRGEVASRSFKTYSHVLEKFKEFCSKRNETQKDLIAVALLEFIEKYGK